MTTDPGELAGELNEANRLLDIAEEQRALLAARVKVLLEGAARAGELITQLAVERLRAEAERDEAVVRLEELQLRFDRGNEEAIAALRWPE